jgi:hypothetical protein
MYRSETFITGGDGVKGTVYIWDLHTFRRLTTRTEQKGSGIVLLLVVLLSWFRMVEVCVLSMVLVFRVSCLF